MDDELFFNHAGSVLVVSLNAVAEPRISSVVSTQLFSYIGKIV
jgi:hypothetical protein